MLSINRSLQATWKGEEIKTMSSLHVAILNERLQQIQIFLAVGMKVNTKDELGRTPLMIACFMTNKRKRQIVCQLLLDHGADVEVRDKFKRTLLMYACATRNEYLLDRLLQHTDADLNTFDLDGNTCLMYAAIEGDVQMTQKILEPLIMYEIDLDVRNRRGLTAYLLALKNGNVECAKLLQQSGASAQISDTENHWKGDKWLESHYLLRNSRERTPWHGRPRTKSQTSYRKKDRLPERPTSMPPLLHTGYQDYEYADRMKKSETKSMVTEPYSATVNVDVIKLMRKSRLAPGYFPAKRTAAWKSWDAKNTKKAWPGTVSADQEQRTEHPHDKVDEVVGDYDAIVRPQTRLSLKSATISLAGRSEYGDTVSVSTGSRNRGQQEELIKIFEEYSLKQMKIPPAVPDRCGNITYNKRSSDLQRVGSAVQEKPRKRRLSTVRAKVRDIKAEVRALNTMKTIAQEKQRK